MVAGLAVVAFGLLAFFGVGGYRRGFLLTAVLLVAICGGGSYVALRNVVAHHTTWALVGVVSGVLLAGAVVELSPPSRAQLKAEADALRLPFYEEVSTRSEGNSRCAPCPVVEREYRAPVPSMEGATGAVVAALLERGLLSEVPAFELNQRRAVLRGEREEVTVEATIRAPEAPAREPLVTVRLMGRR